MTTRLAARALSATRAGAAAILAAALAASMQQSEAGATISLIAGLTVATAAMAWWSARAMPAWRLLSLAAAGAFLVAANGFSDPPTPISFGLARAAGPLAVAAAAASVLPLRAAWWAAIGGLLAGAVHALFFDPFLAAACRGCSHLGIAVWADAGRADTVWAIGWLALLGALVADLRRHPTFVVPAVLAGALYATRPEHPGWVTVCVAAATATWLPRCWRLRQRRIKLQRLLASYEVSGSALTQLLRAEFADPTLTIGYPVGMTRFVDAAGDPLPAATLGGADIHIGHELIARIVHQVELPRDAVSVLSPTATLTLYRQRATAQLAADVRELVERRRHVASAGLAARATLERDLHDGVQQELLALGLDIRLAIASAPTDDGPASHLLGSALALVHDCVDQVRAISTGISPPMLATHGIRGAIGALARRRGIDVDTSGITAERFPTEVEQAAFAALSEALVIGSTELSADRQGGTLQLRAGAKTRDGQPPSAPTIVGSVTDLFAALGGTFVADGPQMEAMLPCVW